MFKVLSFLALVAIGLATSEARAGDLATILNSEKPKALVRIIEVNEEAGLLERIRAWGPGEANPVWVDLSDLSELRKTPKGRYEVTVAGLKGRSHLLKISKADSIHYEAGQASPPFDLELLSDVIANARRGKEAERRDAFRRMATTQPELWARVESYETSPPTIKRVKLSLLHDVTAVVDQPGRFAARLNDESASPQLHGVLEIYVRGRGPSFGPPFDADLLNEAIKIQRPGVSPDTGNQAPQQATTDFVANARQNASVEGLSGKMAVAQLPHLVTIGRPKRVVRWNDNASTSGSRAVTKALDAVAPLDLTRLAYAVSSPDGEQTPPIVERADELRRMRAALLRPSENNVLLVGETGSGKSAVVDALVDQIIHGEAGPLNDHRVVKLQLAQLFAETAFPGERQKNFAKVVNDISTQGAKVILFIEDFDHPDAADLAPQLHAALADKKIRIIAEVREATASGPFRTFGRLRNEFQEIPIRPTNAEKTETVLQSMRRRGLFGDDVTITDKALHVAAGVKRGRAQPGGAVDLLTRAIGDVRGGGEPGTDGLFQVSEHQVDRATLEATGAPADMNSPAERQRLEHLEEALRTEVLGQDEALRAAASAIRVRRSGLGNENAPVGVFLAQGTPGIGKTQTGLAIAKHLWPNVDTEDALLEIAGELLKGPIATTNVTGANPGYIGFEKGGIFDPLLKKPHSVVVINEAEKMNRDVQEMLLTAIEKGTLRNSQGQVIDLRNTIWIMSTNSEDLSKDFSREFLSRVAVLKYRPFQPETKRALVTRELVDVQKKLAARGVGLEWNQQAHGELFAHGFPENEGARGLQKLVATNIRGPLANLLGKGVPENSTIHLGFERDEAFDGHNFTFNVDSHPRKTAARPAKSNR